MWRIEMESKRIVNINVFAMEMPIIGGVLMAYTATVFFQSVHNWKISEYFASRDPERNIVPLQ